MAEKQTDDPTPREQDRQQQEAEQRASPSGKIVYKAILKEGDDELARSSRALFWSGLAAGLSMGFSLITEGLLRSHLPEAPWRPVVAKLGYSVGFLIVVLGRQQLFTENTLTPILPLLLRKDWATARNVLRLWTIVLVANLLGAAVVSWAVVRTEAFDPAVQSHFLQIGQQSLQHPFGTILLRGVFAGWLIALMVWLLPFAEVGRIWVIILITYVVGLGQLTHVIVGSMETFTLAATAANPLLMWQRVLLGYTLPSLIGNTLGGVTLVAALNHAQVVSGGEGADL